jgi:diadenosine tetraphosphate (Ap4A) HIT family hydrolase
LFQLDSRLQSTCYYLGDWPLSQVLLKNEQHYPWFLLVPRRESVQELYQLNAQEQAHLTQEINQLSLLIINYYQPKKLNIATLGNIVSQLHVHCVARTEQDPLWPQGIWQSCHTPTPYNDEIIKEILPILKRLVLQANEFLQQLPGGL